MKKPLDKIIVTQHFDDLCCQASYAKFGMRGHNGRDYAAKTGTPVYAAHSGSVRSGFDKPGYGNFIFITTPSFETVYAHLDSLVRKSGSVKEGELIGYSGSSGFSTAPHLHFGYRPIPYNKNNGFLGYEDPDKLYQESEVNITKEEVFKHLYRGAYGKEASAAWLKEKLDSGFEPDFVLTEMVRGLRDDFTKPLNDQISALQAEVKSLRTEIDKLNDVIKQNPSTTPGSTNPPSGNSSSTSGEGTTNQPSGSNNTDIDPVDRSFLTALKVWIKSIFGRR